MNRKRLLILAVALVVVVLAISAAVVLKHNSRRSARGPRTLSPAQAVATTQVDQAVGSTMSQIEATANSKTLTVAQKKAKVKQLQSKELAEIVKSVQSAGGTPGAQTKAVTR